MAAVIAAEVATRRLEIAPLWSLTRVGFSAGGGADLPL